MILQDQNRVYVFFTHEVSRTSRSGLHALGKEIWRAHAAGKLTDTMAQLLSEQIHRRNSPGWRSVRDEREDSDMP